MSLCETPMADIDLEFVDDETNNNYEDFRCSTNTLVAVPHVDNTVLDTATTSTADHTNNNISGINDQSNYHHRHHHTIIDIDNVRQCQSNGQQNGRNQVAAIDRTGLPTYDTAIRLAKVAAATRNASPQLSRKNINNVRELTGIGC